MTKERIGLVLGPALAFVAGIAAANAGLPQPAVLTSAVIALCATWWLTEPIPIPATSLIPFAVFPMFDVVDRQSIATAYGHPMILLLLGGFILSKAVEGSGAHRRLALLMVRAFGRFGLKGLLLGFMGATALSSMWISNSATVLMMLPVAQAVLSAHGKPGLQTPLMLGIAYAGSVGGIGTPIGTPPNLTCRAILDEKGGIELTFTEWMGVGVPFVLLFIPIAWLWLARSIDGDEHVDIPHPGPVRKAEARVLWLFGLTALAWVTRSAPFLNGGWQNWLEIRSVGDESVALLAVVLAFLIPTGEKEGEKLVDWKTAESIPWGLLLLFAGGIALARASDSSGLSAALGDSLAAWTVLPPTLLVLLLCLFITFLTEVTTNTATAILLMPILYDAATKADLDPKSLMIPAAMTASCAFMLPVATAPNAIVFGTRKVAIADMARNGFVLNLIGAVLATALTRALI